MEKEIEGLKNTVMAKLPPLRPLHEAVLEAACEAAITAGLKDNVEAVVLINFRTTLGFVNALLRAFFEAGFGNEIAFNYNGKKFYPSPKDLLNF